MAAIDEALEALQLQKFPNCTKAAKYLSVNYITLLGRHRPLRGQLLSVRRQEVDKKAPRRPGEAHRGLFLMRLSTPAQFRWRMAYRSYYTPTTPTALYSTIRNQLQILINTAIVIGPWLQRGSESISHLPLHEVEKQRSEDLREFCAMIRGSATLFNSPARIIVI